MDKPEDKDEWRSPFRGGKAKWGVADIHDLAKSWWEALPDSVQKILMENRFQGGPIIVLADTVGWRATVKDLKKNKCLIFPTLRRFPDRVPSVFQLGDAFLELHAMTSQRLLKVRSDDEITVQQLALCEAGKLKKLLGYLRFSCSSQTHVYYVYVYIVCGIRLQELNFLPGIRILSSCKIK